MTRGPTGFVGHGAPLLALDEDKGAELQAWGQALPRPRAVLCVSAHWERRRVAVSATRTLPLIYDFGGFPAPLYQVQYPAPGAPELAARVAELVPNLGHVEDRGLDHGAWVPLKWLLPAADVPVLQLSLCSFDPGELLALGRRLAPLRDEGVFILGSGNITHNLGEVDWAPGAKVPGWASDFDAWIADVLGRGDLDALVDWKTRAPQARRNHPREEHLVPLFVSAGAAEAELRAGRVSFPVTGWEFGSLSRRCVQLG